MRSDKIKHNKKLKSFYDVNKTNMPKRLTLVEQRKLLRALPKSRIDACRRKCHSCQMRGDGLGSILKSIAKTLGNVGKEIGPVVLKELVLPMIKKKIEGKGLRPAGGGCGSGLRLAGRRRLR